MKAELKVVKLYKNLTKYHLKFLITQVVDEPVFSMLHFYLETNICFFLTSHLTVHS